ncbi:hypothetical protein E2C01_015172 [Portunus trituberculatus]|uniref:Uncharacterized protein n=1 Tax=Portunus trituberculatus TaxID=210409 RepID=A0A5B7DMF6_PORTR|nr:hypothetical protein [Portunus trituberculatus]
MKHGKEIKAGQDRSVTEILEPVFCEWWMLQLCDRKTKRDEQFLRVVIRQLSSHGQLRDESKAPEVLTAGVRTAGQERVGIVEGAVGEAGTSPYLHGHEEHYHLWP